MTTGPFLTGTMAAGWAALLISASPILAQGSSPADTTTGAQDGAGSVAIMPQDRASEAQKRALQVDGPMIASGLSQDGQAIVEVTEIVPDGDWMTIWLRFRPDGERLQRKIELGDFYYLTRAARYGPLSVVINGPLVSEDFRVGVPPGVGVLKTAWGIFPQPEGGFGGQEIFVMLDGFTPIGPITLPAE